MRKVRDNRGNITTETAIILPIILVAVVLLINIGVQVFKQSMKEYGGYMESTNKWKQTLPGRRMR